MRAPRRRRPQRRQIASPPLGADLHALADRVSYVGSAEQKQQPSFAGPPRLRADASKCDPALGDREELTAWLQEAVRKGQFGAQWDGEFPRYVWVSHGSKWYEGRLVNRGLGEYKGYPLRDEEIPRGLP
jgi:hypothetical protein